MSSGCHRWSLGFLLLLGKSLSVIIDVHQASVSGTVGQSVLLPVSYKFSSDLRFPVVMRWNFSDTQDMLVSCTVTCSLDAGRALSNCSGPYFIHQKYSSRAEFFPENGSLLLRNLQLSDSGVYSLTFGPLHQYINLTVHEWHLPPQHPADAVEQGHIRYFIIGICSSISLLLLLLLLHCCLRHQGAAQQQKRRTVQQQQISSVEEAHAEGAVVRDMATIYARIGDSVEQTSPRPAPEAVYSYVTPPVPRRLDTGLYHLLV